MSCDLEVTNESAHCWERNFQPYNIMLIDQAWGQDGWISGTIFAFLWTEKLRSIERQKRKSQTSSIDDEQSLSFSDLVRGVHAIASGEAARREKRGRQTEEKKERLPTWPEQIKYYWSILVNKGFIIWPKRSLFLRDHRGKSRTSNWRLAYLAHSGGQSEHRFLLHSPAHGFSHKIIDIINKFIFESHCTSSITILDTGCTLVINVGG